VVLISRTEHQMRLSSTWKSLSLNLLVFLLALFNVAEHLVGQTAVNVTTWQQDDPALCTTCVFRTGLNLGEPHLTYQSLPQQSFQFGQLCNVTLDGQVYAQPLVVTNVTINGTNYPIVVYAVTQNGTVYAINGSPPSGSHGSQTTCTIIPDAQGKQNGTSLLFGRHPAYCGSIGGMNCTTVAPNVGILGTPVIALTPGNPNTGTLYAVVETQDTQSPTPPSNWQHWLYAVDISTLQVITNGSVQVFPPSATSDGAKSTFSKNHIQRPGLLYANGNVYIAFSLMDGSGNPGPNGAIFRYTASNLRGTYKYFATTPDANPAGGGFGKAVPASRFGRMEGTTTCSSTLGMVCFREARRRLAPRCVQTAPSRLMPTP
jgi:hypothetical protein